MCGLAATLRPDLDLGPVLGQMKYRGTENIRIAETPCGSIGHVRLPIVGLSQDYAQPVKRKDDIIAFVGQVLDFREQDPEAQCDLDDVVRGWQNKSYLRDRDGFWHVAVLDTYRTELHAFCDYLAQKPLYYRLDERIVASEISPLVGVAQTSWDRLYLSSCAKWGYCPDQKRTPYEEIKKLLPGQMITIRMNNHSMQIVDPLMLPTVPEDIKAEIERAVKRRVLSSDIPVSALVSGGVDSAIVYTIAKRHADVHAFHVENGEAFEASVVVGDGPATSLTSNSVSISKGLDYMQEPIDLGSLLPQVALSDAMKGKGHVCLSGDGADELFGGYGRSMRYDSQASDVWHELVCWHLPRLDRVMMRNTIELRSPFLARRVAGAALSLPWKMRQNKKILRDLFRADLPSKIADRAKKPLRTADVARDREKRSIDLINLLTESSPLE